MGQESKLSLERGSVTHESWRLQHPEHTQRTPTPRRPGMPVMFRKELNGDYWIKKTTTRATELILLPKKSPTTNENCI